MRLDAQSIASPSVKTGAALNRALTEYRAALTEWDRHLPRLHGWLLAERARLSVSRAIKAALSQIADKHPALARHLSSTIRTGLFCCYRPDPGRPVAWQL